VLAGGELPGHLKYLARAIGAHVEEARAQLPADVLDQAVLLQVRGVVGELEGCEPILSELQHTGELRVVGARYDLDTGAVEWLPAKGPSR
jgi:carbonic anhydrase